MSSIGAKGLHVISLINFNAVSGEGSQFDYTVNTLRVRALLNGQIQNVVLTFRVDAIAQESNETFTLTLNPLVAPTPRVGLFFRNTIQVTIVDSDSKDNTQQTDVRSVLLVQFSHSQLRFGFGSMNTCMHWC